MLLFLLLCLPSAMAEAKQNSDSGDLRAEYLTRLQRTAPQAGDAHPGQLVDAE